MECVLCKWNGGKKGYAQHCSSEKHKLRVRIYELEQEGDPHSDYNLTIKMTLEEINLYITAKIKHMSRDELEKYVLRTLLSKTTPEIQLRIIHSTLLD